MTIRREMEIRSFMGIYLSPELAAAITRHVDVYHIYHEAAMDYLAHSQFEDYKKVIGLAEIELTAIEVLLNQDMDVPSEQPTL